MTTGIIVLGMRSGSSLLTGILAILGATMPTKLLGPASDNAKGFFEGEEFVAVHERINSWRTPRAISVENIKYSDYTKVKILLQQFKGSDIFALKDPRMCSLVQMYKFLFQELKYNMKIISIMRPIEEVTASIYKQQGKKITKKECREIANKYADLAVNGEMITTYVTILNTLPSFIQFVCGYTGLPLPNKGKMEEIVKFVDPSLQHHGNK